MSNFKLDIELIPKSQWYDYNLRVVLKKKIKGISGWDRIRTIVLDRASGACEICGKKSDKLECHEKWEYINVEGVRIQKLVNVKALCHKCHQVKHAGFWLYVKKIDPDMLMNHFTAVNSTETNGCREVDWEEHLRESFETYDERSQHEWHLDITHAFTEYLTE